MEVNIATRDAKSLCKISHSMVVDGPNGDVEEVMCEANASSTDNRLNESEVSLNKDFTEIKEGKANILFPKANTVFYNNVQEFNRDLSIAVIKQFHTTISDENLKKPKRPDDESVDIPASSPLNILEALSATGLRATRYALEIPSATSIIANDISAEAVGNIERNIQHNQVAGKVSASHRDASLLMYEHRFPLSRRFQVIDLDPYGSPAPFLDAAVQSVCEGGLLAVTATDMGGLCGNHGEAAYAKYGGMPLKAKYCHEMALRLVLASMDAHAARYKRHIVPLLSLSADFYIRLFVRVFTSASEVKRAASKRAYVFHCIGCNSFHLQQVGKALEVGLSRKYIPATGPVIERDCTECGRTFHIGGPIWSKPIHDGSFVNELLESVQAEADSYVTADRIIGSLSVMSEELPDCPLYFTLDHLCNIVHCETPPKRNFHSALIRAGYRVSGTHAHRDGLKTDAPPNVVWDVLRCWILSHPINQKNLKENSPAAAILAHKPKIQANFELLPEAVPISKIKGLSRFPVNPTADWGPKARARSGARNGCAPDLVEKRLKLQGKRRSSPQVGDSEKFPFPCKRFKRGVCTMSAEDCRYIHEEVTGELTRLQTNTEANQETVEEQKNVNLPGVGEELSDGQTGLKSVQKITYVKNTQHQEEVS